MYSGLPRVTFLWHGSLGIQSQLLLWLNSIFSLSSLSMKLPDPIVPAAPPQLVGIQSLRAIAALLVIFRHAQLEESKSLHIALIPFPLDVGEAGVDIFFVISGFIMMYVTPRAFRSLRDQGSFLIRRFTRIYPTYWAVTVPIILFWLRHPQMVNRSQGSHINIPSSLLLWPDRYSPALGVAWTLIYELFFYVVASLIFYLAGTRRLYATLAWFLIIAVITAFHPAVIQNPWLHVWLSPLSLEFIAGMLLAYSLQNGTFPIRVPIAATIALVALVSATFFGTRHGPYFGPGESYDRIFVYGLPAVLIVWMVLQMELQNEWRWIKKLSPMGDRSYSAYLLHAPILAALFLFASKLAPHATRVEVLLITIGVVLFLGLPIEVCYRYVEKPSHAWGKHLASLLRAPRPSS
jgi:exopolysaccharide production protein ExoZ